MLIFQFPCTQNPENFARFQWKGQLHQFLILYFVLLMVRLMVFLDNTLIMEASTEELIMAGESVIYFLQDLGFLNKTKNQYCNHVKF